MARQAEPREARGESELVEKLVHVNRVAKVLEESV